MEPERERTTIRMEKALLEDAKRHAREHGKTFTELVDEAVRNLLALAATREPDPPKVPYRLEPIFHEPPLIDISDKDALWAILDSDDEPEAGSAAS